MIAPGMPGAMLGPKFDTFDQSVRDLHVLLAKSNIVGPYVMVGHSLGGLLVRFYQLTYPGDVLNGIGGQFARGQL